MKDREMRLHELIKHSMREARSKTTPISTLFRPIKYALGELIEARERAAQERLLDELETLALPITDYLQYTIRVSKFINAKRQSLAEKK